MEKKNNVKMVRIDAGLHTILKMKAFSVGMQMDEFLNMVLRASFKEQLKDKRIQMVRV